MGIKSILMRDGHISYTPLDQLTIPDDPNELAADIRRRNGGLAPGRDDDAIKQYSSDILSGTIPQDKVDALIARNPAAAPHFQKVWNMRKQFDIYQKGQPEETYGVGAGPMASGYVPLEQAQSVTQPSVQPGDIGRLQQSLIGMGPEGLAVARTLGGLGGKGEAPFAKINPKDFTPDSVARFQETGDYSKLRTQDQKTGNEIFDRTAKLRGEYTKLSGDFMKVRDSFSRIEASAQDPSAAGDLSMIFNYMKMLDPGSVVRESEFATAANSAGVPDKVRARYNRLLRGERLAPETRADFLDRSKRLFKRQNLQHEKRKQTFTGLAKRAGTDPRNVVIDLEQAVPPKEKGTIKFLGFE